MNSIILENVTLDEFKTIISEEINRAFKVKDENQLKPKYFTRKETSEILKISLPTLHTWTKQGIIEAFSVGSRILYKESDVNKALEQVGTLKYRR